MDVLSKKKWPIFLGLLPALIIYVGIAILPIIISFIYSFFDWNGLTEMKFIGLQNYKEILMDVIFWKTVKNNVFFLFAGLLGQIPLGLILALLLNWKLKGVKFFRTIGFMPVVISAVIVSLTWGFVYNSENGLINSMLEMIGFDSLAQNWLGDPAWAMLSVSIAFIWQNFGLYMVIFLAALQNVPTEIIDAAKVDGATGWQQTWRITIPMIWESIIVGMILSISSSLRAFDLIYVMTNGGPFHSTEVMTIFMYENTFSSLRFGFGSAISILILVFSLLIVTIATRLMQQNRA